VSRASAGDIPSGAVVPDESFKAIRLMVWRLQTQIPFGNDKQKKDKQKAKTALSVFFRF
jgi:hypothetical protein